MPEFTHTPFSNYTDAELIRIVDADGLASDLTRELASRLESALEELGIYIEGAEEVEVDEASAH